MRTFQNLTHKCIKGIPIDEVQTRTLQEIGFPVEASSQPDFQHSLLFNRYFTKLYDSPYSVIHTVEKQYIKCLLESGNREIAFNHVLTELSPFGITVDELIVGLTSGCVYSLTAEEAETMLDEFIFIIEAMLPRQLSDIYYSFDIEPNPAHGVFFDMASEQLKLPRHTNRSKNNYGQFISHTQDGVKERILSGETFQSIYLTTCATKTIINEAFSGISRVECEENGQDLDLRRMENGLFRLSRQYHYGQTEFCSEYGICSGFTVYEQDKPVIEVVYLSEQSYHKKSDYDAWLILLCSNEAGLPRILLDYADRYTTSVVRDAIQQPESIARYHKFRSSYFKFGTALDDCYYNWDDVELATVCGCFGCEAIFKPNEIVAWNCDDACCPRCGKTKVITDSQGYQITEEFLHDLKVYADRIEDDEDDE